QRCESLSIARASRLIARTSRVAGRSRNINNSWRAHARPALQIAPRRRKASRAQEHECFPGQNTCALALAFAVCIEVHRAPTRFIISVARIKADSGLAAAVVAAH